MKPGIPRTYILKGPINTGVVPQFALDVRDDGGTSALSGRAHAWVCFGWGRQENVEIGRQCRDPTRNHQRIWCRNSATMGGLAGLSGRSAYLKEILKQLTDAYRKVRNTCRFLLSNLYDFEPGVHSVPHADLPELDQWALWRLGQLIDNVKKGYAQFQFRQVVHEWDYFCSTDMSATYLDILKDRLYTFPANSPLRRGSQTVLYEIVSALARLMAPILSFTAEEIWQVLPESTKEGSKPVGVHLADFPESPPSFKTLSSTRHGPTCSRFGVRCNSP